MKNQTINLISLYFLIIGVGLIFLIVYFLICLVLANGHNSNTIITVALYCLFAGVHLLLNIFVIAKPQKFTRMHRVISSACILLSYILIAILFT